MPNCGNNFSYGPLNLLFDVLDQAADSFKYDKELLLNKVIYIVGTTGSGKSTLLNYLAGVKLKVGLDKNGLKLEAMNK